MQRDSLAVGLALCPMRARTRRRSGGDRCNTGCLQCQGVRSDSSWPSKCCIHSGPVYRLPTREPLPKRHCYHGGHQPPGSQCSAAPAPQVRPQRTREHGKQTEAGHNFLWPKSTDGHHRIFEECGPSRPRRGRPPGSRNKLARAHPSQVTSSTSSTGLRWHGGTLAPPPFLAEATTDLSQLVDPEPVARAPAAVGAGTCAHTPSNNDAKRVVGEVHPAQPPTSAAERLAALRMRVLAKANAVKQ